MSTPLTDAINALTAYANETTGLNDTALSDAVGSLVAGYGGSSGLGTITATTACGVSSDSYEHIVSKILALYPNLTGIICVLRNDLIPNASLGQTFFTGGLFAFSNGEVINASCTRSVNTNIFTFTAINATTTAQMQVGDVYNLYGWVTT